MKRLTLGDVCKKASSNIAQKDLQDKIGAYPIYGASGLIKQVDFYQQDKEYIAVVKDGAGIGRTMLLPAYSSVIGTMQYLLPKEGIPIDIKYLFYAVEHMNLAKYFSGATIPHIYFKDYQKEPINIPDIDTQRKISRIFDKIDVLITSRKEQRTKLDQIVKSRFVEMFGDPTYNPKGYKIKKLSQLGELNRGVSKARPRNSPELLGGPYPLVQTGEVTASELYINTYENTYSEKGLAQSRMWPKGTLCITIAANIAQTAILNIDACFPDSVVGFIPGKEVTQIYMHYWFTFFQKILEEQAPQVAQKNINLKILNDLDVMLPERTLQEQFEKLVNQTDKSKLAIQKSLDKLEILKKALMQKYFG